MRSLQLFVWALTLNGNGLDDQKKYTSQRRHTDVVPNEISHHDALNWQDPDIVPEHADIFEFRHIVG